MGGGGGQRDLKEKGEKFRLPSDPKESNKDTACILLWLLIIAEIDSVRLDSLKLPWWLSGKESTCQCRKHGFDP